MKKLLFLATTILAAALYSASANAEARREVTVWSWFIQSTMQKSIAAFEKAHPDIKVNYTYYNYSPEYITALKAAAASGQPAGRDRPAAGFADPAISRQSRRR